MAVAGSCSWCGAWMAPSPRVEGLCCRSGSGPPPTRVCVEAWPGWGWLEAQTCTVSRSPRPHSAAPPCLLVLEVAPSAHCPLWEILNLLLFSQCYLPLCAWSPGCPSWLRPSTVPSSPPLPCPVLPPPAKESGCPDGDGSHPGTRLCSRPPARSGHSTPALDGPLLSPFSTRNPGVGRSSCPGPARAFAP